MLLTNRSSLYWPCLISLLLSTWSITKILLERLETSCGISSLPLLWIKSYLSDRTQMFVSDESRTSWVPILLGVPQGSVLGPLLFILYTADIPTLFSKYSAIGHLFADDVQAHVHGPPSSQLLLASKIELLSNDLNSWMSSNRLSLNSAKTQLIWFGTPQQLLKLDHALLSGRFPHFSFHTTVRDLGVTLGVDLLAAHFQLNSLLLLPTEASENHSQSCICSYFHLHCPRICLLQD